MDIGGWHVYGSKDDQRDLDDYRFPPGFILQPGQTVRLHSGEDGIDDPASDVYRTHDCVWNNKSETVRLVDASGERAHSLSY